MMKNSCSDKSELRKGTWTPEEDSKLIAYVTRYGHWNWTLLPKFAGLARSGKSCRLRWLNYLRPNIKRGNYTQEEDETIINLVQRLGNRWSTIAAELPGRTDNEIKNYWHTNLRKRPSQQKSDTCVKPQVYNSKDESPVKEPTPIDSSSTQNYFIPEHGLDEFGFVDAYHYQEPMNGSLWLEPYVAEIPCELDCLGLSPVRDLQLWSHEDE